jgi:hypothetical protein
MLRRAALQRARTDSSPATNAVDPVLDGGGCLIALVVTLGYALQLAAVLIRWSICARGCSRNRSCINQYSMYASLDAIGCFLVGSKAKRAVKARQCLVCGGESVCPARCFTPSELIPDCARFL